MKLLLPCMKYATVADYIIIVVHEVYYTDIQAD